MLRVIRLERIAIALIAWAACAGLVLVSPPLEAADGGASGASSLSRSGKASSAKPRLDRSGRRQVGKASIYSHKFAHKKMANGRPMDPGDDNAASKTLPLGTKAIVTNLETGKSTEVTIEDRGPHVKGRIIDLPPAKAVEIGLSKKEGVATVEVAPLAVPTPEGGVKLGEGASASASAAD
jgi:rare lipoprotein A